MRGKFTMFFFPLVSTKGSGIKVVFLFYRRRNWVRYRRLRQESVPQHLPQSKDEPEANPGQDLFLKFLERKAEWSSRRALGSNPCSTTY